MESKTKALTVQQRADLALRAGVARLDASHQVVSGCVFLSLFHCLGTTWPVCLRHEVTLGTTGVFAVHMNNRTNTSTQ